MDKLTARIEGNPTAMMRPLIVLLFAAFLAGCAEAHWHKAGAEAAVREQDLAQCRQTAQLEARYQTVPTLGSQVMIGADPQGRPIVKQGMPDTDRFLLEQDLVRACMRGRGYELVPADKR